MSDIDDKSDKMLACTFCAKTQDEVRKLIAGPSVFICDECISLCNDIIKDSPNESDQLGINLPNPKSIKEFLDKHVIGQQNAKKMLSVSVYNHYKRILQDDKKTDIELSKSNLVLLGATGCGKTLLAETLARFLKVPFAIADATTLTEAGYVGEDVENIIQKLLRNCDYDISKAEKGIIYIDEIDKITRKSDNPSITRDVSGEGVQQALLKLMEGTIASIPPQGGRKHPQQDFIHVNTSNILFICGGAFSGLDKIIMERTEKSGIGFSATIHSKDTTKDTSDCFNLVRPEDLIKYGLIPEFIGRLPVIVPLNELKEQDLVNILVKPHNAIIKQYQYLFEIDGVKLEFHDDSLRLIAKNAIDRNTGARGLRSVIENALLETMYEMPSIEGLEKVVIDSAVIHGKAKPLLIYKNEENEKKKHVFAH